MLKTLKFKLYNNDNYQKRFDKEISICRKVYNAAKETYEYAAASGVYLSEFDLNNQLPSCKKEFPYLKKVHSGCLQAVISTFRKAYDNYYRQLKNGTVAKLKAKYLNRCSQNNQSVNYKHLREIGRPKWAKKKEFNSIQFKTFQIKNGKIKLPNWGFIKVFNEKYLNKYEITRTRNAILKKEVDGLYISIVIDIVPIQKDNNNQVVGIDMGIKYFCVTSDGEFIDNPRFLEKQFKTLRVAQRKLSRKYKKGVKIQSKNYYKQVDVVARLHKKVKDARRDFLHKKSTYLANNYNIVIHEDLNIAGMVKSNLSRHIYDVSWGTFFLMLAYKTQVIKVNPAYTSQKCSNCGHICKENRLTQSIFKCVSCNFEQNADHNGSLNIKKAGTSAINANLNQ